MIVVSGLFVGYFEDIRRRLEAVDAIQNTSKKGKNKSKIHPVALIGTTIAVTNTISFIYFFLFGFLYFVLVVVVHCWLLFAVPLRFQIF